MVAFDHYAQYYDLFYQDKEYDNEASYVHRLIQKFAPKTRSILELGCGTGKHASLLAENGYVIHGVDISSEMLRRAQERLSSLPGKISAKLQFSHGDIGDIRLDNKYDAVIALFHVVSYQTSNNALQKTFETVKHHLDPNGIFIFDVWYGPAVLSDPPVVRVKRFENDAVLMTRIAEPDLDVNENIVKVHYQLFVKDKRKQHIEEIRELHTMRYFFKPELELFLGKHGLGIVMSQEWMTGNTPGTDTWGVCFVSKKTK
jgi:SAM-dependent methyltransferase